MRATTHLNRTTVHLIRHADAVPEADAPLDANVAYDALGLTTVGQAQAAALARRLAARRGRPVIAVYSSRTRRAHETACALGAALGLDVTLDDRLREIDLGPLDCADAEPARRAHAIRERLTDVARIAARDGSWNAIPGAERAPAVRRRMSAAIDAIVERHPGAHVAVVSHAGAINAYLAPVIGTARDFFFPAGNTSLSSVRFTADGVSLLRLNDTAHLEAFAAATTP